MQDVALPPFIPLLPLPPTVGAMPNTLLCRTNRCSTPAATSPLLLPLYREARAALDFLIFCTSHSSILLSIASRGSSRNNSKGILTALNLWQHFTAPQIYNKRKSHHFRSLTSITSIAYHDMLFFDDNAGNIALAQSLGVTSVQVGEEGFTIEVLLKGLADHISEKEQSV